MNSEPVNTKIKTFHETVNVYMTFTLIEITEDGGFL